MIKDFAHKGLQAFFETGSKSGIQPHHAARLRLQLAALNQAQKADDMAVPNWHFQALQGKLSGHWSVTVNGNWRLTFRFDHGDAHLVDYQDYH